MRALICTQTVAIVLFGLFQSSAWAQTGDIAELEKEKALLGKSLFFDENLSKPVGQSCATCHDPKAGFASPDEEIPVSQGAIIKRFGDRNTPSVSYAMYSPEFHYDPTMRPGIMEGMYVGGLFWDGRVNDLEEQAKAPFINLLEMHNPNKKTVVLAVRQSSYAEQFEQIFGTASFDDVDSAYEHIAEALAAYERSPEINPFTSKFDYWKKGEAQLTDSEMRGYTLFTKDRKSVV